MCGIAGLWSGAGDVERRRPEVERMIGALRHRGPDDRGIHMGTRAAIGMTRLSIVDLASGHQPLSNEDGRIVVVCNGEIYNHEALRRELAAKGHAFKSRSDVEVVSHLYEEYGLAFVEHLRGMFAIALWDATRERLVLARDRIGIKPLFYANTGGVLRFGSEIKALMRGGALRGSLDRDALDAYLTFGYVPCPLTIYEEVRKLEPGHLLVCDASGVQQQPYWRLRSGADSTDDEETLTQGFIDRFRAAVQSHLMSDVAVGAFLSGGVDSGLVVALMAECHGSPVKTFTAGFQSSGRGYLDERPYARMISRRYGTTHVELEIQPKLEEVLDEVVTAFDEPFADDSVIPSYYICKLARSQVTVGLTGLGGDELFGGYERHLGLQLGALYGRVPSPVRRLLLSLLNRLPERKDGHHTVNHLKRFARAAHLAPSPRYLGYLSVFDAPLRDRLCTRDGEGRDSGGAITDMRFFDSPAGGDLLARALHHDTHTYLPDDVLALTDRLSMQHSLELRVPFLDHPLVEFCAAIPSRFKIRGLTKKYLLKKAARAYLPDEVLDHRKQGFASPMSAWLRGALKTYVVDALSPRRLARHGLFDAGLVGTLLDEHMSRRESRDRQLFTLLMFQKWHERYMS
jgi:asparagine synthase (glutamine-hydrolysing)